MHAQAGCAHLFVSAICDHLGGTICVSSANHKLGDLGAWVETVRGFGYRFRIPEEHS